MRLAALLVSGLFLCAPLRAQTVLPVKSYGQELVDQVVAKHPELLAVVMHVSTPTLPDYPIIASNIGRYGKVADRDDLRVVNTGEPHLEASRDRKRFEVEVAMRDIVGTTIGALGLVFAYRSGDDPSSFEKQGNAIRDALARRVLAASALIEPHPLDPSATTKTHAQKIVDDLYARHPELNVIALHVDLSDHQGNIILASTFGRIGKKGDDDDLAVIRSGEIKTGIYGGGKRFGVELPMFDVSGKTVGALSVGYPYASGDDEKVLVAKAVVVRDELKALTTSAADLVELDP